MSFIRSEEVVVFVCSLWFFCFLSGVRWGSGFFVFFGYFTGLLLYFFILWQLELVGWACLYGVTVV